MNSSASAVSPSTGSGLAADLADLAITARLRAADYRSWRTQVEATRGCAAPIHLCGSSRILDRDGAVLLERTGTVLAPCGNRRASGLPGLLRPLRRDAFHLLRAGLAGDDAKGVPETRGRAPAGVPHADRAVVRAGAHAQAHPPRTRRPLPLRGAAPPRRPPPRHRVDPEQLRLRRGGALAGPRRAALGPVHHPPCAAPWPPPSASGPRLPRPRPAVLRQGRRIPTPRARALPRRHPPRRPRRARRPATRRAHPRRRCATPSRAAARRTLLTATRPTGHRSCWRGARSSTSAPSRQAAAASSRTPHGRDHRRRPGRLHRQVRHQVHRRVTRGRRPAHPRHRPHRPPRRLRRTTDG